MTASQTFDIGNVVILLLTTVASISGALNMLFLKSVLAEIADLRKMRNADAETLATHGSDIEWLKRSIPLTSERKPHHA